MERIIIVIVGPTCSGKTKVGISIAKQLDSEIISADSRQIYKYLSIGTAKPSDEELFSVKHNFVDSLEPNEVFNVSKYECEALQIIDKMLNIGKMPVVVGGSGLYVKALVDGIFNSVDVDEEYRKELLDKRKQFGNEYLYEELKKVDPESAGKMFPQNWKRVMRAIEVFHVTGQPIWKFQQEYKRNIDYNFVQFGLNWDRKILYRNIEARVDRMISEGLADEVKKILSLGYSKNMNALNTVGYKEIISYLDNEITLERAVELIKRNTRRFAKRQLTWFRKDERINWLDVSSQNDLNEIPNKILNNLHLV